MLSPSTSSSTHQDVQIPLSSPIENLESYPPYNPNDPKKYIRSLVAFLFKSDDQEIIEDFCKGYKEKIGKSIRNWTKQSPDSLRKHLQPKWDNHKRYIENKRNKTSTSLVG